MFDLACQNIVYVGPSSIIMRCLQNKRQLSVDEVVHNGDVTGNGELSILAELYRLLAEASTLYKKKTYAVDIIMADSYAKNIILEFDVLPRQTSQINKLIQARIEKEFYLKKDDFVFQTASLMRNKSCYRASVFVLGANIVHDLERCVSAHGGVVRHVTFLYQYVHNAIEKAARGNDSVFLLYDERFWTVSAITSNEQISCLMSRDVDASIVRSEVVLNEVGAAVSRAIRILNSAETPRLFYANCTADKSVLDSLLHEVQALNPTDISSTLFSSLPKADINRHYPVYMAK